MKTISFLILSIVALSCAYHGTKRSPSSSTSLESKISSTQEKLDRLEKIRYASRTEVFVDFKETGSLGKGKYQVKATVYSNHIEDIESVSILVQDRPVKEVDFAISEGTGVIDTMTAFHLPLGDTHIRFTLKDGDVRDVELECTILGGCLR